MLRELDVVQREEFEAVKAMAEKAGKENERLKEIADAKANKA
jgi:BMFP domain-containing protein YqiC